MAEYFNTIHSTAQPGFRNDFGMISAIDRDEMPFPRARFPASHQGSIDMRKPDTITLFSVAVFAAAASFPLTAANADGFVVQKVAEKPLSTLPEGDLYWTAEKFPSVAEAQAAVGDTSVAAEIDGAAWLLTIGPKNAGNGGEVVASVGPIQRFDAPEYLIRINTGNAPPGSKTSVHSHPGSEAIYILSGEVTIKWPDHTDVVAAGGSLAGQPPHTPMEATSTGDEALVELIMFVVDASQDFSKPAVLN
jgi:quercetin dioxygenase-like cupin family protein